MDPVEESGDDLSFGDLPDSDESLADRELKEMDQRLVHRRVLFWGGVLVILGMLGAMVCYVFWGQSETPAERITIVSVLAIIPTVLSLALLRYVFARNGKDQSQRDDVTLAQAFAREVVSLFSTKS
jgi:hypothetical protein